MKHKNSHLLVGYWSRLRRGRSAPFQGDIDPRAIKRLLSYVFILDCENPARPVYRLAGTALCERFDLFENGTGCGGHHATSPEGDGMMSGRSSYAGTPVTRATSKTRSMGTTSHCDMADRVTPSAVANLDTPPAMRTARSLGVSDVWLMVSIANRATR